MDKLSSRQFRNLSILVLVFGAAWIGFSTSLPGGTTSPGIPAPRQGFLAPDFTLETLEGESISLSELQGQAVLVNLWASWCLPCQKEMPAMERMYQEYAGQGFTILAVNVTNQDSLAKAQDFVSKHALTFPIVLDRDGRVSEMYNLMALPSSFFVDRDGVIQEVVIGGPMAEALLRTRIENILEVE